MSSQDSNPEEGLMRHLSAQAAATADKIQSAEQAKREAAEAKAAAETKSAEAEAAKTEVYSLLRPGAHTPSVQGAAPKKEKAFSSYLGWVVAGVIAIGALIYALMANISHTASTQASASNAVAAGSVSVPACIPACSTVQPAATDDHSHTTIVNVGDRGIPATATVAETPKKHSVPKVHKPSKKSVQKPSVPADVVPGPSSKAPRLFDGPEICRLRSDGSAWPKNDPGAGKIPRGEVISTSLSDPRSPNAKVVHRGSLEDCKSWAHRVGDGYIWEAEKYSQ